MHLVATTISCLWWSKLIKGRRNFIPALGMFIHQQIASVFLSQVTMIFIFWSHFFICDFLESLPEPGVIWFVCISELYTQPLGLENPLNLSVHKVTPQEKNGFILSELCITKGWLERKTNITKKSFFFFLHLEILTSLKTAKISQRLQLVSGVLILFHLILPSYIRSLL